MRRLIFAVLAGLLPAALPAQTFTKYTAAQADYLCRAHFSRPFGDVAVRHEIVQPSFGGMDHTFATGTRAEVQTIQFRLLECGPGWGKDITRDDAGAERTRWAVKVVGRDSARVKMHASYGVLTVNVPPGGLSARISVVACNPATYYPTGNVKYACPGGAPRPKALPDTTRAVQ